jgi:hypothetical protein
MAKEKNKKTDQKKLIDVPLDTLKILAVMATRERMPVKAYMEKVLIDHANENSEPITVDGMNGNSYAGAMASILRHKKEKHTPTKRKKK